MEREGKNKALFVCGGPRFYPRIAECCLALQISALAWMDTGGLCWPCSHCLHPLRSAMQINPNERAAEGERAMEMEGLLKGEKKKKMEGRKEGRMKDGMACKEEMKKCMWQVRKGRK